MSTKPVDIKELARLSGVSVGTVSRALNGYPDVREATRERVMRLAEELDYAPAAAARQLKTRKSHVVGVFLETGEDRPDLQHPFFHEVLVGLKRHLGASGYDLLLFASERSGGGYGSHSILKRCRHRGVDGVVLMGITGDGAAMEELTRSALPCISVDVERTGRRTAWVSSDSVDGMRLAVEHLAAEGHTRIATIAGPTTTTPGRERLDGFRRAMSHAGLALDEVLVVHGDFYFDSGVRAATELLQLPAPPTAIVAASDMMAMGAMRAARSLGRAVPGELALVGFDDIAAAGMAVPGLTTIRQDKAGLGEAAAKAVLARIDGTDPQDDGHAVTLPVSLVVRGSTAPPARTT